MPVSDVLKIVRHKRAPRFHGNVVWIVVIELAHVELDIERVASLERICA